MQVTGLSWKRDTAKELSANSGVGGYVVYNLTVEGDHTFFVGNTGGGTWVHNGCTDEFKDEAIRRAEEAGYRPYEDQRPVNWDQVEEWSNNVQEPGFQWRSASEAEPGGDIIVGENNAVVSGQHRILGGLMGDNPVPEEAISRTGSLPTKPWQ